VENFSCWWRLLWCHLICSAPADSWQLVQSAAATARTVEMPTPVNLLVYQSRKGLRRHDAILIEQDKRHSGDSNLRVQYP
jgi:hypothetical protein